MPVLVLPVLLTALFSGFARAEFAGTIPAGSAVVYAGPGLTTYAHLSVDTAPPGGALDRALQSRLDLYGAYGLTDHVQLAVSLPVVYSTVATHDSNCSGSSDFCTPVAGVGQAGVQVRYRLVGSPLYVTGALGLQSGAWLAAERGRFTMPGEATTDIEPVLLLGKDVQMGKVRGGVVASAQYTFRLETYAEEVSPSVPADDVRAAVEVKVAPGSWEFEVGAATYQRLGGDTFSSTSPAWPTDDRWAALDYDNVQVHGKVSYALPGNLGVHAAVSRVVWVRNGPPDAMDVAIGVHKYWAPRPKG